MSTQTVQVPSGHVAPEGVVEFHEPLREGKDYGVPYHCDDCGAELRPCEHKWGEWSDSGWGA
jgi:hypothetical protein